MSNMPNYGSLSFTASSGPRKDTDIRDLIKKEDEKKKKYRIELVFHTIFIVIFIALVLLHRASFESYVMNQALITSFITQQIDVQFQPFPKTFLDIGQPEEFAGWLISVVGATLDSTTFYNGANKTSEQQNYVMFASRLVGGVRIRQLRVEANKSCSVASQIQGVIPTCYPLEYSSSTRDTKPFGPPDDPDRYVYLSEEETGSASLIGYMIGNLEGGGYTIDANIVERLDGNTYTEVFQDLIDDMWIDIATRAVIVSMTFVNADGRIAVIYMFVEIPGSGVLFPHYMIRTFGLDLYNTPVDIFRAVLEVIFVLFVFYLVYTELREMITHHKQRQMGLRRYFNNGWNVIELVDIVLYIVVIVLYMKFMIKSNEYDDDLESLTYTPQMERLADSALQFYNVCAFNVILTTFRTFKFLKLNHRLNLLWKALEHAGLELVAFLFIFLIFIFGFIFMSWMAFGPDLTDFSTFNHSFATCWNFIVGNVPDYDSLYYSNRVLGPAFFVMFTVFVFFILANVFIAILTNSFEVVKPNSDRTSLNHTVERKIREFGTACKRIYNIVVHKERDIYQLLDHLQSPELLDGDNVSRDNVAQAIGPSATELEIDELYNWIKKLEARKTLTESTVDDIIDPDSLPTAGVGTPPPSSLPPSSAPLFPLPAQDDDTKQTLRGVLAQMTQLENAARETQEKMNELHKLMLVLLQQKEHKE